MIVQGSYLTGNIIKSVSNSVTNKKGTVYKLLVYCPLLLLLLLLYLSLNIWNNFFFYKVYSVINRWLEIRCNSHYQFIFWININYISTVTNGCIDIFFFIND